MQQVSYGPLIMSCYTGFFNVRREWQSLNTGPQFYLRLIRGRVGCEFIHPAQPTDAPSSRRSSRSHFYTPGLTPFRELVAVVVSLGRRNLVPILPTAHPLGGGFSERTGINIDNALFLLDLHDLVDYPRMLQSMDLYIICIDSRQGPVPVVRAVF